MSQSVASSSRSGSTRGRRSSLTFKGPAAEKRVRAPPKVVDPIPARRRSSEGKKKRRSSASSAGSASKGKGKEKASETGGLSDKARGKRRRVSPEPSSDEEEDEENDDASTAQVRPYERHVARSLVQSRWKTLSEGAREDVRYQAERTARELLDDLPSASSSSARSLLARYADELDTLLTTLPCPPLPSALRIGRNAKGKGREMEIGYALSARELKKRTTALETAYQHEQAEVDALEAKVEEERRLLEADEAALEMFEGAREKLRGAEEEELKAKRKDVDEAGTLKQKRQPLVRSLLSSRIPLTNTDRSNTLGVPGLKAPKERRKEGAVSRERFRRDDVKTGGKRKRGDTEGDDDEQEPAEPATATTLRLKRATKELQGLLTERRRGRKTSE
ncbi:hypothetical protein JCM10213v2_007265 [Rhodosporidiobolus nylandii]